MSSVWTNGAPAGTTVFVPWPRIVAPESCPTVPFYTTAWQRNLSTGVGFVSDRQLCLHYASLAFGWYDNSAHRSVNLKLILACKAPGTFGAPRGFLHLTIPNMLVFGFANTLQPVQGAPSYLRPYGRRLPNPYPLSS